MSRPAGKKTPASPPPPPVLTDQQLADLAYARAAAWARSAPGTAYSTEPPARESTDALLNRVPGRRELA